jgi:hypothetical protein
MKAQLEKLSVGQSLIIFEITINIGKLQNNTSLN